MKPWSLSETGNASWGLWDVKYRRARGQQYGTRRAANVMHDWILQPMASAIAPCIALLQGYGPCDQSMEEAEYSHNTIRRSAYAHASSTV